MFRQIVVGVDGQEGGREAIASVRRLFAREAELSQKCASACSSSLLRACGVRCPAGYVSDLAASMRSSPAKPRVAVAPAGEICAALARPKFLPDRPSPDRCLRDAHLVGVPRRRSRLQAQEAAGAPVPGLRHAGASARDVPGGGAPAGELSGRGLVVIVAEQYASRLVVPASQRSHPTRWSSHKDHAAKALRKLAGPHLPASLADSTRDQARAP